MYLPRNVEIGSNQSASLWQLTNQKLISWNVTSSYSQIGEFRNNRQASFWGENVGEGFEIIQKLNNFQILVWTPFLSSSSVAVFKGDPELWSMVLLWIRIRLKKELNLWCLVEFFRCQHLYIWFGVISVCPLKFIICYSVLLCWNRVNELSQNKLE